MTDIAARPRRWDDDMIVDLPDGEHGRARIDHLTVSLDDSRRMSLLSAISGDRARIIPGTYTRLFVGGTLWMSDTPDERRDHVTAVTEMKRRGGRVLIMGLGIGMVLKAALALDHVTHVDVVELNPDVIALVGPHYTTDPRVTIHQADAYTIAWPKGTRWDVVWHDIWPHLSEDNLPQMARLKRRYARWCDWQGCWGQEIIRYYRDRSRW